jgi:hypothetical protein
MGCVGISSNIWSARNGLLETSKNKTFSNEPRDASRGRVEMSTISLYRRHSFEATSKTGKVKTPSQNHDYFVIMGASSIFLGIVLITLLMVPVMIASYSGLGMEDISDCRKKIIGSQQMGYYSSPEQFRLAESYCYIR